MSTTTTSTENRNPFRSAALSPNTTANVDTPDPVSISSSAVSAPPPAADSDVPLDIPDLSPAPNINDEAPPAYTPSADPAQGETTVEFGPRRPFQQPTTRPQHQAPQQHQRHISPQPTASSGPPQQPTSLWQQLAITAFGLPSSFQMPVSTGSSSRPAWTSYAGGRNELPSQPQRQDHHETSSALRIPPPRHPLSPSSRTSATSTGTASSAPSSRPTSDFARDFYAVGPDASVAEFGALATSSSSSHTGGNSSHTALPPDPPSQPNGASTGVLDGIPDDGRPTTTPVPGHPLLKDGKLLVYPIGHVCEKCLNTGYKASDPSNPCRKCWSKYAKPYAGALLYTTPWTTSPAAASSAPSSPTPPHLPPLSKNTFQRPLPVSRPPQQRRVSDPPNLPPRPRPVSAQAYQRPSQASYQPPSQSPSQPPYPPPPPPRTIESHFQNPIFRNPLLLPFTEALWRGQNRGYPGQSYANNTNAQYAPGPGAPQMRIALTDQSTVPPPGSLVLRPGDPRLGGRVCWRCGGDGVVPFMLFEEVSCGVCQGVGRVFG